MRTESDTDQRRWQLSAPRRSPSKPSWWAAVGVLAAFSLFSPLSLLAVNAPRGASAGKFFVPAAATFFVALALVAVLGSRLGLRRATAIGAVLLFGFFSWSALRGPGKMVPVIVVAVMLLGAIRFGTAKAFHLSLATAGVALLATPLPALVSWYAEDPVQLDVSPALVTDATGDTSDVYIIVLDGYGRADVLAEVYGFDNGDFVGELEQSGFAVPARAYAPYSSTAGSLASTLAMEYLIEPGTILDHPSTLALHDVVRGDNPVVQTLRGLGYHYVHIESGWDGSRCGSQADTCHQAAFLDEAMWTLLGRTPLAPVIESRYGHAFALNGLRGLEALHQEAVVDSPEPRFVFAHVVLPHPPLTLDADCRVRREPGPGGGAVGARFLLDTDALEGRRGGYTDQIECVNSHILRFLDEVDDDAVVLITGDHGPDSFGQMSVPPREWTNQDIWERLAIFSAYRLHAACPTKVTADTDLLNGMRALVGCAIGRELEPQQPRAYILPLADGAPNPTTEVDTKLLGG